MADHNPQHGRRPHFHRGRRGPDRRGSDRRLPREHAPEPNTGDTSRDGGVDVERIMREIRSRIAQQHGIELSTQQIQELAARRLEAILEPRSVKPQLLEQLRRSAGSAPEIPSSPALESYEFEETTLYETHRGILRFFRQLLNPILKLFFNPAPLISALNTQARINKDLAARELERERRQSEWNALQYELVQRVVLEMSRISVESQALSHKIESLGAKVDFNDRRVRGLESIPSAGSSRQPPRQPDPVAAVMTPNAPSESAPAESASEPGGEGTRRRRRRRRGRRSGGGPSDAPVAAGANATVDEDVEGVDVIEGDEDDTPAAGEAVAERPNVTPAPAPQPEPPTAFQPAPETPPAQENPAHQPVPVVPSPPRDEPVPADPVDHADPGPVDR